MGVNVSLFHILSLMGLTVFAIYRQTRMGEIAGANRFNIALVYAGIAGVSLISSDRTAPGGAGWFFLLTSLALSAIVGIARGRMTRIWLAEDGRYMRAGTMLTVGLFIIMLAVKIGLGLYAHLNGIEDGAGFAEILIVVATMVAVQAEIVFRRAARLRSGSMQEGSAAAPDSFPKSMEHRISAAAGDQ